VQIKTAGAAVVVLVAIFVVIPEFTSITAFLFQMYHEVLGWKVKIASFFLN
jgi:hypothetical protein